VSRYTATVRCGPNETRYDVNARSLTEARTLIAERAGVDTTAVRNPCRVLGHTDWEA